MASTASISRLFAPADAGISPFVSGLEPEVALTTCSWRDFDRADRIGSWDALAQWAIEPNPFYESWYLLPSLRMLDPAGEVQILCFQIDGQLAGLMPVRNNSRYYGRPLPHLANWVHPNCFLGLPLVAMGCEALFWREVLRWADERSGLAMFMHLEQMPLHGPLHRALVDVLHSQKRVCGTVLREDRALLDTSLDPQSYRESVYSASKRKAMRRKLRRLGEVGEVHFDWQWDDSGLSGWIADFLALEASGWKGRAGSALACAPETRALFEQALTGAAQDGKLMRLSLRLDGRPIAMLSNFVSSPGAFGYKTAFDEDYAAFSPGVLMECEFIEALGHEGIDWCDSCAAQGHSVMDELWTGRRPVGSLSLGIGGVLRRAVFERILHHETNRQKAGS